MIKYHTKKFRCTKYQINLAYFRHKNDIFGHISHYTEIGRKLVKNNGLSTIFLVFFSRTNTIKKNGLIYKG